MTVFFRVSSGDLSQGVMHLRYKTKSPTEIPKAPRSSRLTVDGYGVQKSTHFYPVVSTPSPTAAEAKLETQSWVNSPPPTWFQGIDAHSSKCLCHSHLRKLVSNLSGSTLKLRKLSSVEEHKAL